MQSVHLHNADVCCQFTDKELSCYESNFLVEAARVQLLDYLEDCRVDDIVPHVYDNCNLISMISDEVDTIMSNHENISQYYRLELEPLPTASDVALMRKKSTELQPSLTTADSYSSKSFRETEDFISVIVTDDGVTVEAGPNPAVLEEELLVALLWGVN